MTRILLSRRSVALHLAAIPVAISATRPLLAQDTRPSSDAQPDGGLSQTAQAIHQEVYFAARRKRIYRALTSAAQFDSITRLSDAADLLAAPGAKPVLIDPSVGGMFTLFGGYITGRQLELLPDERLVQAWRAGSWAPGEYSIARFTLLESGAGTKLVFDHRGFPEGQGASLAYGWRVHYWEPMAKFLLQGS